MTAKIFDFEEILEAKQKERRQKDSQEIIFDDVDALIDFIHDWLETIVTKEEMMLIARRLENTETK